MAINADSVTVELIAKTEGYNAKINAAAAQTEAAMGKVASSTERAETKIKDSTARIANAQRNLGRQFADVGASLSSGSSPFVVLAQQLPQIADAVTDTGGKAARFAAFLTGPWGAALLAAGSVAGVLAGKLLEGGDSADSLNKKLEENAAKARATEAAQAIFAKSLEGTADASAKLVKQLEQQNRSQIQVAQSALAAATALRQQSLQNLRAESSRAAIAVGTLEAANSIRFGAAGVQGAQAGQKVAADQLAAARKRVAIANKAVADSEKAVVEASIPILRLQGAENADKSAAATGRHERAVDKLTEAYRKAQAAAAKLGGAAGNEARARAVREYRDGIANADRQLQADQEANRSSGRTGRTRTGSRATVDRAAIRDAKELNDLVVNIGKEAINSLDGVDRLLGLSSKNNLAGFNQIFGRAGVDFATPDISEYETQVRLEGQAREQMLNRLNEKQQRDIQTLASLYQDAFEGGVGGIWETFKEEGLRAIAIVLAKLTLGKSLGDAFGAAQSGLFGGLFGGARASGGNVVAGKLYKVNENGPELFQPAQSGKIYPTGAIGKARSAGGGPTIVQQSFTLDARGGVVTEDLLRSVNTIATQRAAQAGQAAYQNSPARAARLQQLGT